MAARPAEDACVARADRVRLQPPPSGDGARQNELIVIGQGKLIASGTIDSFVSDFTRTSTLVRSPQLDTLIQAVTAAVPTVEVTRDPDSTALLTSVETAQVGEIAAAGGLVLHQLARTASLEEAFFEATGATEEYVGRLLTGEPNAGGMQ